MPDGVSTTMSSSGVLLLDQVREHHREQPRQTLVVVVAQDLNGVALGSTSDRLLVPAVEDGDELTDLLRVPQVERDRADAVLLVHGKRSAVQVLVVVGEHVERPGLGVRMQREERRPPPLPEVLGLVHDDGVVPWPEPGGGLGERLGQRCSKYGELGSASSGGSSIPASLAICAQSWWNVATSIPSTSPTDAARCSPSLRLKHVSSVRRSAAASCFATEIASRVLPLPAGPVTAARRDGARTRAPTPDPT